MCFRLVRTVAVFLFLLIGVAPGRAETIVLANGEWPPYLSQDLPEYGYASAVVAHAFEAVGITVRYEFYPWARAEALVRAGKIDGSVIWSHSEERAEFALFSDPVVVQEEVIYFRRDKVIDWQEWSDLRGLRAAVPLGSKVGAIGAAVDVGMVSIHRVTDIRAGFRMLLLGRVDIFPLVRPVAQQTLKRDFTDDERDNIVAARKVIDRLFYRLMLSNQNDRARHWITQFNQGLSKITASGERDRLQKLLDAAQAN